MTSPMRLATALLIAFFSSSAPAVDVDTLEKSVVRIFVDGGTGTGSIVAQGVVLTNDHVVSGSQRIRVASKHTDPLDAQVLWGSSDLDLAILRVHGLNLPSVTLATKKPGKGDGVWAFGYPGASDYRRDLNLDATVTRGVISLFQQGPRRWGHQGRTSMSIIQHDSVISSGNSGGPLFDDCGRVVGVNSAGDDSVQGVFLAPRITEAIPKLEDEGISLQKSDSPCTPSSGGGIAGLEIARQQAETAQQDAATAQQDAATAQQDAATAQQDAATAQQVAGAARQEAEKAGYISLIMSLGIGVLALIAIALALRKPRRQIIEGMGHIAQVSRRYASSVAFPRNVGAQLSNQLQSGLAAKERTALVLAGFDTAGKKIRIMVPEQGTSAAQGGYVIGRQAMLVDYALEDASISRRHARVLMERGNFEIEDINSTNGTWINNRRLGMFAPTPVSPGDKVIFGTVEMQVSGCG